MINPETATHYASKVGCRPIRKFVGDNPFSKSSDIELIALLEWNDQCYQSIGRNTKTRIDAKFFRDQLSGENTQDWDGYVPFGEEGYCELFDNSPLQLALMLEARKRVMDASS